jgi:hypothetical protein
VAFGRTAHTFVWRLTPRRPARLALSLRQHGVVHWRVLGAGPHGVLFAGAKLEPLQWHATGPAGDIEIGPSGLEIELPRGRGRGGGHFKVKF